MTDVYQIGKVGTLKDRHKFEELDKALELLDLRLGEITGPYQIRRPGERFSSNRPKKETVERVRELLEGNEGGLRLVIRGTDGNKPAIAIRRTFEAGGPEVLQEAIRYIGVPYHFGIENPLGPEGGPGAEVDCSGLICVCYAVVDVDLPHNAEMIHKDSQVKLFKDHAKVRPGDIVLYHTGSEGRPADEADHCAVMVDRDNTIVAPRTGELVQRQPVNLSALLTFAYVESVTGPH